MAKNIKKKAKALPKKAKSIVDDNTAKLATELQGLLNQPHDPLVDMVHEQGRRARATTRNTARRVRDHAEVLAKETREMIEKLEGEVGDVSFLFVVGRFLKRDIVALSQCGHQVCGHVMHGGGRPS